MKNLKQTFLAVILGFGCMMYSHAQSANPNDVPTVFTQEIQEMFTKKPPKFGLKAEITTKIEFEVNDDGEIVVLNIESDDELIKRYIRSTLNYKRVKCKIYQDTTKYVFPLTLQIT